MIARYWTIIGVRVSGGLSGFGFAPAEGILPAASGGSPPSGFFSVSVALTPGVGGMVKQSKIVTDVRSYHRVGNRAFIFGHPGGTMEEPWAGK